ncbi:hypothetical protein ACFPVX_04730 [Cohnella faecalis]|uniref:Uncharacterized protein n=1 Tax=Cohnella faecalis TaxID=2315694 RepID=A0A398CKU8_9BACL|nr:hypothetical protein [Cohnella faecalis]RIE03936.1 hypothetical protein D3H35_08200 [Cohnella faecalis]
MKTNNKWVVVSLCFGIVFSSFSGITFGSDKKEVSLDINQPSKQLAVPPDTAKPADTTIEIKGDSPDNFEPLFSGSLEQLGGNSAIDPYSIDADQLEKFLNEGYGLEDIFRADEIGNQVGIDPEEVLHAKTDGADWEDVQSKLLDEKQSRLEQELRKQFSSEYNALRSFKLTEEEKSLLLLAKQENRELNITDVARAYQQQGKKAISDAINQVKTQDTAPEINVLPDQEAESQEGLTKDSLGKKQVISDKENSVEVNDLPPLLVEKLKAFAEANQIPLEELLQQYKDEKNRQSAAVKMTTEVR